MAKPEFPRVYMGDYVREYVPGYELDALRRALERAGYVVRDVPNNPWQLFAVDGDGLTGGVYCNSQGLVSMPAEIHEYLTQEVRNPAYGFPDMRPAKDAAE